MIELSLPSIGIPQTTKSSTQSSMTTRLYLCSRIAVANVEIYSNTIFYDEVV